MIKFCPWCGNEVKDPEFKFCTFCGGSFSQREEHIEDTPQSGRTSKKGKAGIIAASIAVAVLLAGTAGVLCVGGVVDFEVDYDGGDYVLVNKSKGIFTGFTWTVEGLTIEDEIVSESKYVTGAVSVLWESPEEGKYNITLTAHTVSGIEWSKDKDKIENGVRGYTVSWEFQNIPYSVDVEMSLEDYYSYVEYYTDRSEGGSRWPGQHANAALIDSYMQTGTDDSDVFENVIYQLKTQADISWSAEQTVNYLMGFVQNLDGENTYKWDSDVNKQTEYWSFPIETLFVKGGDCEDLAMLMMAIFQVFFEDDSSLSVGMALFFEPDVPEGFGHAMATIYLDGLDPDLSGIDEEYRQVTGEYFSGEIPSKYYVGAAPDGKQYYACETTDSGFTVGNFGHSENEDHSVYYAEVNPSKLVIVS